MKHLLFLLALAASAQQIKINPITGLPDLVGSGGGGTGAAPYGAAVAAQTTLSVAASTHLQGTDPIATCYEGTSPFIATACYYTKATNGDIVFTWSPAFTGRVVIIGGGTGATGATGATGPAGATGATGAATFTADARTGTTEALVSADCGQAITFSNAGAVAVSLPASPLADGCTIAVKNIGGGDVTITPVSGTISGAASVVMSTGENSWITSNGTNYEAQTVHLTVDSALSITRSRTSQQIGVGATVATLSGTQTLTNKEIIASSNSIGPDAVKNGCTDTVGTDSYACNISPAITAYTTNRLYTFVAGTANTGAASINFNSLGAKTIVKVAGGVTTALADNDIRVGQVVLLSYDGTNMQMQSTLGNAAGGGSPGGSGTELQYRGGASTFSALAGSSVPNSGELQIGNAISPAASVTRAIQTIGAAIAQGSGNGTMWGVNAPSGFTGYLAHGELNGVRRYSLDYGGILTLSNPSAIAIGTTADASTMAMGPNGAGVWKFASTYGTATMQISGGSAVTWNQAGPLVMQVNGADILNGYTSGNGVIGYYSGNSDINYRMSTQKSGSAGTAFFGDRTVTTGFTKVLFAEGQGQATTNGIEYRLYNATVDSGTLVWSIAAGGIPTWGSTTEATCNSGTRGQVVMVQGGAGVADTFRICKKDAADAYAWTALY